MARSIKDDAAPPKAGHNKPPLSKEDKAAILQKAIAEIRKCQAAEEGPRAELKEAQAATTAAFNQLKVDLGKNYTRKYVQTLVEDFSTRLRNVAATEEQRFNDRVALGLPVFGKQQDLFDGAGATMPQEAKDEIAWEADGYLFGRRCDERKAPEGCPPRMDQAWLKGYDRGQDETAKLFARAEEIAKPAAPAEPEEPEVDEEAEIRRQAKALKDSGFTDKTTAPAEQVAA